VFEHTATDYIKEIQVGQVRSTRDMKTRVFTVCVVEIDRLEEHGCDVETDIAAGTHGVSQSGTQLWRFVSWCASVAHLLTARMVSVVIHYDSCSSFFLCDRSPCKR
jgi:hypothetical protein